MSEFISAIFIMLIAVLSIGGVLFLFGQILYLIFSLIVQKATEPFHYVRFHINPTQIEQILNSSMMFYRNLLVREKRRFTDRLKKFMNSKEFIGRENLEVSKVMTVLISASAIQITFGLEEYMLPHFSKIFIYPKVYYSRLTRKYHKGDVNLLGGIAFSWEDFKDGYAKQNDNYNVGLHEMAHALRFSSFKSEEYDRFFVHYFDKWSSIAMDELNRIRKEETSYLRKYAGTNINEFFSVCIEYFFESPKELREKIPALYKHMCILLNQNPLESISIQTPRHKLLAQPQIDFSNQIFLMRTRMSAFDIIVATINICALLMIVGAYIASISESINMLTYFPLLAPTGLFVYLGMARTVYVYENGIKIKYLFSFFRRNKCLSYEDIIGITFTTNKISKLIRIRYIENEKIIVQTFPYNLQEDKQNAFAKILKQNKIVVSDLARNAPMDIEPKEESVI